MQPIESGAFGGTMERGYTHDKDEYLKRLRRIEGQVRGLQRMVGEDAYCIDVLTQISSVKAALHGVAIAMLDEHLRHCVAHADPDGDTDLVKEAMAAVERLVRS